MFTIWVKLCFFIILNLGFISLPSLNWWILLSLWFYGEIRLIFVYVIVLIFVFSADECGSIVSKNSVCIIPSLSLIIVIHYQCKTPHNTSIVSTESHTFFRVRFLIRAHTGTHMWLVRRWLPSNTRMGSSWLLTWEVSFTTHITQNYYKDLSPYRTQLFSCPPITSWCVVGFFIWFKSRPFLFLTSIKMLLWHESILWKNLHILLLGDMIHYLKCGCDCYIRALNLRLDSVFSDVSERHDVSGWGPKSRRNGR